MTGVTIPQPNPVPSRSGALPGASSRPDTVLSALLLAATGGLLDAVVYLNHGHVFANAMTGNVIFLGIAAIARDWLQVGRHLVPLLAFAAGVSASRLLRATHSPRVPVFALLLEAAALFSLGFLPTSFPEMLFTAIIAFVSALQVATFRQVGRFSYNSTFITGNLRDAFDSLLGVLLREGTPEDRDRDLAKSRKLALICLFFLVGALAGAWAAPRLGNRSFWLAEPLLLLAGIRNLRRQTKEA